jgi:hypothetical protein
MRAGLEKERKQKLADQGPHSKPHLEAPVMPNNVALSMNFFLCDVIQDGD